ncbi:UDP-GalNAc:beta-1,3-N-acetylgalactosaminyltransferase 1 [Hydra vulgaris]|uniref:Hexosyltransferase n=1 Tax=Hydra vulgaris TaxID=6087 RepID=T2MAZ4_HYDVU|nr:UDP-GalNAc:beta-1,3-N-acetylgalactosaminyltransferase 1 [Hydra vulgaris]
MLSLLRRKKVVVTCIGFCVVTALFYQQIFDRKWEVNSLKSVVSKLHQYHTDFKSSINFTNLPFILQNEKSKRHAPHYVKKTSGMTSTELHTKAKTCLEQSGKQIAKYLQRSYETTFSVDHVSSTRVSPILEPECKPNLDLIIIITTKPGNFFNRAAIRAGYGRSDSDINKMIFSNNPFRYLTIFTVGRDTNANIEKLVESESRNFKDILRLDYKDTYENLANKTLLTIEWLADHCPSKFVLKSDDDCFVNVFSLGAWVPKQDSSTKYIGRKNEWMPVIRDPWHRNYVPFEDFSEEYYKPYCAGGGYMLSGSILKNITIKAKSIKQIINEDAYMGMVTNALNIFPKNDERFLPFIFSKQSVLKRPICQWRNKFVMHGVYAEKQITMHWNAIAMNEYKSICEWDPP